jgi:hypothetical protein
LFVFQVLSNFRGFFTLFFALQHSGSVPARAADAGAAANEKRLARDGAAVGREQEDVRMAAVEQE